MSGKKSACREKPKVQPKVQKTAVKEPVKLLPTVEPQTVKILKFLSLDISQDSINVNVDKKYRFTNLIINPKERKFVFDFKGKLSFYTKRKKFKHPYFKSVVVGTHPKHNFFRVVIVVKDEIKFYKEGIQTQKGIVSVSRL